MTSDIEMIYEFAYQLHDDRQMGGYLLNKNMTIDVINLSVNRNIIHVLT
jgi:hypothetical protein